jgi:hypothetical protein
MRDSGKKLLARNNEHRSIRASSTIDASLFNEIVALLAEILVLDFQQDKQITVGSPPQTGRNDLPDLRQ